MHLTYLDSNSWLIEFEDKKILLDPWLVGDLVFGNLPWLFKGKKNQLHPIPENIDLILLSQGLEDHAHPPTLKQLDRHIPVVASPNATRVVQELGYTQVTTLDHGKTFVFQEAIEIRAIPGSSIGPTLVENGYILKDLKTNQTIYYEPHGYHDDSLQEFAPIDVVITPIVSLKLPLLGSVIKGQKAALKACQLLKPRYILSTAAGGDVSFEGLLISLINAEGSVEQFQSLLEQNKLSTKAINPESGKTLELKLEPQKSV
jgi:L-ascorbate metabolism protein UlaG (beta-lactamase superfamily)